MENVEMQSEEVHEVNGELATLFKVLAKPDGLKIFLFTGNGIATSKYTIEELDLTPKKYYNRLRELVGIGLIKKKDGVYRQTALGGMIYDRFLPAMGKAVDAKDELEFLVGLKGMELETEVRKLIEEGLGIPDFAGSTKVRLLGDYESMAVNVIDLCDEAKESILIATNHLDVRVLDAIFRSMDRGVKNNFIIGREVLSSRLQQLRMLLSPKFTMAMMKLASSATDMSEIARVTNLPYSFCVMDGHINMIEISNAPNVSFIAAFHVKNRGIGEKLTDLFETLWNAGESHSTLKLLGSFKA